MLGVRVRQGRVRDVEQAAVPIDLVDEVEDALVGQLFARSWSKNRVEGSGGAVTSHTKQNNDATPICSGKRVHPRAEQRCSASSSMPA